MRGMHLRHAAVRRWVVCCSLGLLLWGCDGDDGDGPAGDASSETDVAGPDGAGSDGAGGDVGGGADASPPEDASSGADAAVGSDAAEGDAATGADTGAGGDGGGGDGGGGAPCLFEGSVEVPRGQSRCPCPGCDEVVYCTEDGIVTAGECLMGFACVQLTETEAACDCTFAEDGVCPPEGLCPGDPDCSADPCVVNGRELAVGDRACNCETPPCPVLLVCDVGSTLREEPCPQGLHCIEIDASIAGCLCDEATDEFCPPACPQDPDCGG